MGIATVRIFLDEATGLFWTNAEIEKCLELTEIFHILSAVKILKLKDEIDWKVPNFEEIVKLLQDFQKK